MDEIYYNDFICNVCKELNCKNSDCISYVRNNIIYLRKGNTNLNKDIYNKYFQELEIPLKFVNNSIYIIKDIELWSENNYKFLKIYDIIYRNDLYFCLDK